MPTMSHQLIAMFLCAQLFGVVGAGRLGTVLLAPFRVRLWPGKYREPDVVFMRGENESRCGESFWDGADLVMEVVSEDDRRRDLETKRTEYAQAGIPEYWVVDPQQETITVLCLESDSYREHGVFPRGTRATSVLLPDFAVAVDEVMGQKRSAANPGD